MSLCPLKLRRCRHSGTFQQLVTHTSGTRHGAASTCSLRPAVFWEAQLHRMRLWAEPALSHQYRNSISQRHWHATFPNQHCSIHARAFSDQVARHSPGRGGELRKVCVLQTDESLCTLVS